MVPLAAVSSIRPEHNLVQNENYTSMATMTSLPAVSIHDSSEVISCDFSTVTSEHNISTVTSTNQESNNVQNLTSMDNIQKISIEQLTSAPIRFKKSLQCDMPNCNKEFMSEPKLKKHKSSHNKDSSTKSARQITVECPVKKILENGLEESCGRIFHVREELVKHLNEEHTIEEAAYRCQECGRRFFWASGLRAHARAHAGRAGRSALACPWPGCARVFRQPCRLREHARAHTGDKPYPCRYPNCGWSFRTASKLLRHARRHTGERRHACATCGRAFLRREHLRDHAARHHAPAARRAHACPHAGNYSPHTTALAGAPRAPLVRREHLRDHAARHHAPAARRTHACPHAGNYSPHTTALAGAPRAPARPRRAAPRARRAPHLVRREHLRDHAARHHAPAARRTHACPHAGNYSPHTTALAGAPRAPARPRRAAPRARRAPHARLPAHCQQSFTNMSSLYMHTKKVHKKKENDQPANPTTSDNQELPKVTSENLFMVSLLEAGAAGAAGAEEAHAARTHCTWPLARAPPCAPDACVLADDVQVEQSEGFENNIYTVRSDLFLHGNVLHNEDSEPMSRCVRVAEDGALALDADLLLDAPSVHLDQEELYTDAVDESSFRVFLLSGEELA
ncbi:zinc finger protein 628-like [Melitaea cinxia]|uniref:zinc finger protein 628-like n=1 Tax=Melitaea cinxia TaxID=113334 RepID=UPI001E2740C7|nr:zinc finger protein 628-like [Melitaea cinxia]